MSRFKKMVTIVTGYGCKLGTMDTFEQWLLNEMHTRDISMRELARNAGISHSSISLVLSGQRGITAEFCQSIAHALKLPEEEIFLRAGLLTSPLSRLFAELSPEQQEVILAEMRQMVEENERSTQKAILRTAPARS